MFSMTARVRALLCLILDPAMRRLWEVYNVGPAALVQQMLA
jgi:hypothetical protein